MYNEKNAVWSYYKSLYATHDYIRDKRIERFMKYYFNENFFVPYSKNAAVGINMPLCRESMIIEVGHWNGRNWKRDINGDHIGFYFWNHGGAYKFEKADIMVKMIYRPDDPKRRHDVRFYICKRNLELEPKVLFDEGYELGMYKVKEYSALTKMQIALQEPAYGYCGKTIYRDFMVMGTFETVMGDPHDGCRNNKTIIVESVKEKHSNFTRSINVAEKRDLFDVHLVSYMPSPCIEIAKQNLKKKGDE